MEAAVSLLCTPVTILSQLNSYVYLANPFSTVFLVGTASFRVFMRSEILPNIISHRILALTLNRCLFCNTVKYWTYAAQDADFLYEILSWQLKPS